jgi:hypothetical protein
LVSPLGGVAKATCTDCLYFEPVGPLLVIEAYELTLATPKTNAVKIVTRFTLHRPLYRIRI